MIFKRRTLICRLCLRNIKYENCHIRAGPQCRPQFYWFYTWGWGKSSFEGITQVVEYFDTFSPSSPCPGHLHHQVQMLRAQRTILGQKHFFLILKLSLIENTNWSSFINRSSSTKTSVLFQFHWHLFETASLVPPSPISWSKAIAISSSLKWCWSEKICGYLFAKNQHLCS